MTRVALIPLRLAGPAADKLLQDSRVEYDDASAEVFRATANPEMVALRTPSRHAEALRLSTEPEMSLANWRESASLRRGIEPAATRAGS